MITRVTERDGSLWIEIPDSFVKALNITAGQPLHIALIDDKLIIKPDDNDACIVCETTSQEELIRIWKNKMRGTVEELGDIVESTGEKWDADTQDDYSSN